MQCRAGPHKCYWCCFLASVSPTQFRFLLIEIHLWVVISSRIWEYETISVILYLEIFLIHPYVTLRYVKSLQSCLTLCDPIDSSPPGSPVPGILQARTLEWVAISFSNACKWKVKVKSLSRVQLCATPRTVAYQAPPSMGFSRQEYWSQVPLHSLNSPKKKKKF